MDTTFEIESEFRGKEGDLLAIPYEFAASLVAQECEFEVFLL